MATKLVLWLNFILFASFLFIFVGFIELSPFHYFKSFSYFQHVVMGAVTISKGSNFWVMSYGNLDVISTNEKDHNEFGIKGFVIEKVLDSSQVQNV
jgi:hypothetical protein